MWMMWFWKNCQVAVFVTYTKQNSFNFQVLYKKRIGGTTDLGQITFSVSALAAFTLVTMWPIVLALYITKAERWQWESIPWDIICKNSAASMGRCRGLKATTCMTKPKWQLLAFNYLINLGVAWTNPVFTSLGFLLAVPLAHCKFGSTLKTDENTQKALKFQSGWTTKCAFASPSFQISCTLT